LGGNTEQTGAQEHSVGYCAANAVMQQAGHLGLPNSVSSSRVVSCQSTPGTAAAFQGQEELDVSLTPPPKDTVSRGCCPSLVVARISAQTKSTYEVILSCVPISVEQAPQHEAGHASQAEPGRKPSCAAGL